MVVAPSKMARLCVVGAGALCALSACSRLESRRISPDQPVAGEGGVVYCLTRPAWVVENAPSPGGYRLRRIDLPDRSRVYDIRLGGGLLAADGLSINGVSSGVVQHGPMSCGGEAPDAETLDPEALVTADTLGMTGEFPGEQEILGKFRDTGKRIFLVARPLAGDPRD